MSLFGSHLFAPSSDLGQVTLPEPASDSLIHELAITGGATPSTTTTGTTPKAGSGFRPTVDTRVTGAATWAPYALVGGGIVIAGVLIWSAMRRPRATPNRRRARRRRR